MDILLERLFIIHQLEEMTQKIDLKIIMLNKKGKL